MPTDPLTLQEQIEVLRTENAALRRELTELRELVQHGQRLGPKPPSVDEQQRMADKLVQSIKAALPVDRTKLCTTDGRSVVDARASQTNATGQHPSYIVLCDEERAKGFVRPYRDRYKHLTCGGVTTMGRALSETYARDPSFYGATFCCTCNKHLPVAEFVWTADGEPVGS